MKMPLQIRFIRAFGNNDELNPPILYISGGKTNEKVPMSSEKITIEMDIMANVSPSLYVKFFHCNADWTETDNVFINSNFMRTSNINWTSAFSSSLYFSHRASIEVPNSQIQFKYAGNWKAKFFDYENDSLVAEAKFFVVKPKATTSIYLYTDLYDSKFKVTKTSLSLEAVVQSTSVMNESQLRTVVFYNNNRWNEPIICSNNILKDEFRERFRYKIPFAIGGFSSFGKRFRIDDLPAENQYRILDLTNTAQFPRTKEPMRIPFSEAPRNGNSFYQDDNGLMITSFLSSSYDDYVYVEFALDPLNLRTREDLFVVGSFNNWIPSKDWQMHFDESQKMYLLRQWVRRARHNYLFATGKLNFSSQIVSNYSYDEFEGNTSYSAHTYFGMVYLRQIEDGGYDELISIGAANIFGQVGN